MSTDSIIQQVRITKIIQETKDAKTFELEPLNDWKPEYKAGQYLTLVFKSYGNEDRRSYSFSSSPAVGEPMRITVKWVTNGEYSRKLLTHANVGDVLDTIGVGGFYQLPDHRPEIEHLFFFAAGSGITPVYSLLKTALQNTTHKLTLIYSNKSIGDTIFYHELQDLHRQYPERFAIEFLFSDIFDVRKSRLSNWLLLQLMPKLMTTALDKSLFYLCGPTSYMQMIRITLLTEGAPANNIIKENFSTEKPKLVPTPPDVAAHRIEIHLKGKTYQFTSQYPDTILAAAKKEGLTLPYSCEAGRCGSCAATCTQGEVWMAYNEVLIDEEIQRGRVLTCQGFPVKGDVVLNYPEL